MKRNGFLLFQSLALLTIGSLFLLTALRTYSECLLTMQKKINLEKAIAAAETVLSSQETSSNFTFSTKEISTSVTGIILKEVQVKQNDKLIYTLTQAK